MNQTFKQKALVAAISAAVAFGAAGVSTQAVANEFEASIVNNNLSAVNLLTTATTVASKVGISGLSIAAQGTAWTTNGAGAIRVTIPASLDLVGSAFAVTSPTVVGAGVDANLTAAGTKLRSVLTVGTTYNILASKNFGTAGIAVLTTSGTAGYALYGYNTSAIATSLNAGFTASTGATSPASNSLIGSVTVPHAGGAIAANDIIGSLTVNADGTITLVQYVTGVGSDVLTLPTLYVVPTGSATAGSSAVITLANGSAASTNLLGISDTSFTVANFVSTSATLPTSYTVVKGVAGGTTPNTLTLTSVSAATPVASTSDRLTLSLSAGKFVAAPTVGTGVGGLGSAHITATLNSDNTVTLTSDATGISVGDALALGGNAWLDTTGVAAGTDITLTVAPDAARPLDKWVTLSQKVASVAAAGATAAYFDANADGKYYSNYSGRAWVANTGDSVRITENLPGSLPNGATLVATLSNGATFAAGGVANTCPTATAVTGGTVTFSAATPTATANGTVCTYVVTSASSTNAAVFDLATIGFDTTNATAGDVTIALSGSAGISASAKISTVIDATSASVSGTAPSVAASQVFTVGDIVITENKAGAIATGERIIVNLPVGSKVQSNGGDSGPSALVGPTIKAFKADGTDVTSTIFGAAPTLTALDQDVAVGSSGTYNRVYSNTITAGTATTTGPVTIKISGLQVRAPSNASAGDLTAIVASNGTATTTTATLSSTTGMKKASFKIATVGNASQPTAPTVTVADQTKAVISGVQYAAASNDQGKSGSVYAFIVYNGVVLFEAADGTWAAYTGASPAAYYTGSLGTTSINYNSTAIDLTPFKGALFGVGYGIGIPGLSDPFKEMLTSSRFNVLYTVK